MIEFPKAVIAAVKRVSDDPAWLDLMRADWPYLEIAALADQPDGKLGEKQVGFGQSAVPFSKSNREALGAMKIVLAWAGPGGDHVRGYAPYMEGVAEQEIVQAVATLQRVEAVLAAMAANRGKQKKRFLPALAKCVCDWNYTCHQRAPAWSAGAPAVDLMMAIAEAFKVVLDDSSHAKALGKEIKARKES